jgi:hypothetical protein
MLFLGCAPLPPVILAEKTMLSTTPAVFTLGNNNNPRTVKIAVANGNRISKIYSNMIGKKMNNEYTLPKPQQQLTITNVRPGQYYMNLGLESGEWAVNNDQSNTGKTQRLTFRVYLSVNDGPWTELGSADTAKINDWWNIKVTIP